MTDTIIEQNGGKSSTNIQNNDMSKNVIVVQNGATYGEMKEIALDVYKNEAAKNFSDEAAKIAKKRVETLVDNYLTEIFEEKYELIENLKRPSMQYSLYNAEKGYALDETGATKEYYINMLKSRLEAEDRSILQIGLDEAIKSIEKVTKDQMDCLSFMFLIYNFPYTLNSVENLKKYCNYLCDFYHESYDNMFNILSLRSINACTTLDGVKRYKPIQEWLNQTFPGLLYKGQSIEEIVTYLQINSPEIIKPLIISNIWDNKMFQINALNVQTLEESISKNNLYEIKDKIISMFNQNTMTTSEIKEKLISLNSNMEQVISFWENNDLKYSQLTPSGLIIAISNLNNKKNEKVLYEKYLR